MSDGLSPPPGHRDGSTYEAAKDFHRLNGQAERVWSVMRDGKWHTLASISAKTGDPEASISARIRDFAKERFGGVKHERRRVDESERTRQHEYRLILKEPANA